jgi:hypothetical protein
MANKSYDNKIFWRSDFTDGEAKGGYFFRAVEFKKKLDMVEESENGGEIVGIRFDDNNVEFIVRVKD